MLFIIGVVNGAWNLTLTIKNGNCTLQTKKYSPHQNRSTFFYGKCELKIVQCYKYLGTYIDENLSFAEHPDAIAAAGSKACVGSGINYIILKNVGAPDLLSYIPPVYVPFSITAQLSGETRNL